VINLDDSLNFQEDPLVANIMLPNAKKLGPSIDTLDNKKNLQKLEVSM
jgi:hypothetical protein